MSALEDHCLPQYELRLGQCACGVRGKGVPYEHKRSARIHRRSSDPSFGKIPGHAPRRRRALRVKAIASYIDRVFDGPKVIPDAPGSPPQVEQWVRSATWSSTS